ncbi:M48 family metalloprotease [Brevundimonas sp. FT23042]|uniref:M48 family metalloprotease n=1 Tax=Brevundimonas sp. FT23042 TaxID=3393749 RepID=UPI003B5861EE
MLSRRFRIGLTCAAVLGVATLGTSSCGGSPTASVLSESPQAPARRLTALTDLDQAVARVAWRLSENNADLCPVVRQSAGWALHSANQYTLELRPDAETRFGLRGDLPGVLAVPPGSPADQAGLRVGDLILSVSGTPLAEGSRAAPPRYEGLAANVAALDAALAGGAVTLAVRRGEDQLRIVVTPRRACGYEVQLNPSNDLNARADGRRLFISTALAQFAASDDELALILGHELAHNVLGHRRWSEAGGVGRTVVDRDCEGGLCGGDKERQADRTGLYLMARAGYRPDVAAPFWRRFGASNWQVRYPQLAHASAGTRARRLEEVTAEIETLRSEGQPLLP